MPKSKARKPTSFDVARLAGVSRSAVSRAFTPGANISDETRDKVTRAASDLRYRVNLLARGLQQEHSGIVGLVASRLDTPLRSRQVRLLSERLLRKGFKPMLITAEQPEMLTSLIDSLLSYSIAGMIITSDTPPRALIEDCGRLGLPVVLINRAGVTNWGDRVVADNETAGRLAARTLIECGATKLGCLLSRRETYSVSGRARAFREAASRHGFQTEVIHSEDQEYATAREAVLAAGHKALSGINGLFCATDLMALGAMDAIRLDLGLSVPRDVQVIGFDDIEQAGWASYDLSTFRQNIDHQADTVIRLLIERLEDIDLPRRIERVELSPVLRGTTRHG